MTAYSSIPFALTGWQYGASVALLETFLEQLRHPEITEGYHLGGGLYLSRMLAQLLVDNRVLCGISTAVAHSGRLQLPATSGAVMLERSRPAQHWRNGDDSFENSNAIFMPDQREAMRVHMAERGQGVWLARNYVAGEFLTVDVGHSARDAQAVVKARITDSSLAGVVTLHGKTVEDPHPWVMPHLREVARYLGHALPGTLGIHFGVRVRCVADPSRPNAPWYILDLRPTPRDMQLMAERF